MGLAIAYSIMAPRRYEATTRVVINPENSNPLGIAMGEMNPFGDPSLMQETQVRVMQSDAVAWDVIRQLRLDKNPEFAATKPGETPEPIEAITPLHRFRVLAKFHKRLRVASVPKTAIVELAFRSKDPKLAAEIVNSVANVYLEHNFRTRYNATMQASEWLSKQLEDLKSNAQSKQQQFADFQKKSGIIGMDDASGPTGTSTGAHSIIVSQLEEQNQQLVNAQSERIVREARYREAMSGDPAVIAETAPTATLQALQAQQTDLKNQYAQLSAQYGNAYPRVVQMRTQLSQVETSLQTEAKNVRNRLQAEYQSASTAEKMAAAEVETTKQQAYKMNETGIQYLILKRDLEASRDLYEDLLKKLKEAGIVAGLKSTNVNVVDPADIPVIPVEPNILLNLLVALMLGSAGGVGLAFLMESFDTTIGSPEHAEMLANMPVLCVVPHMKVRKRAGDRSLEEADFNKPMSLARPQSAFAESFRALRTTLLLSAAGKPPKVLLVTSSVPGEGKTTTSINCAVALAQNRCRVLLVDADMRTGGLQARLALDHSDGLSQCLTGSGEPQTAVVAMPGLPDLHILFAGIRPPAPAELLGSDQMRDLLEQWRNDYDYIVIDTPPVLALTDAAILASMSDGILLVVRTGVTRRQTLCRTRDLLRGVQTRTIGVVLNDFDPNSSAYFAHYGYTGDAYDKYYGEKQLTQ
jgi:capsular exopolysaccharide synthesis family protein